MKKERWSFRITEYSMKQNFVNLLRFIFFSEWETLVSQSDSQNFTSHTVQQGTKKSDWIDKVLYHWCGHTCVLAEYRPNL